MSQRTNRSGAIDYIERVLGALKAPGMSIDDATKEIQSFIEVSAVDPQTCRLLIPNSKSTEHSEKRVQSSAKGFDELRRQVESYIIVIEKTLLSASAHSSISELRRSISELDLEIVATQAQALVRFCCYSFLA